jgi:hypothetical protein
MDEHQQDSQAAQAVDAGIAGRDSRVLRPPGIFGRAGFKYRGHCRHKLLSGLSTLILALRRWTMCATAGAGNWR